MLTPRKKSTVGMELNLQAQQGRILKLAPEDRPQALKAHTCSNMSRQAFLSSFGQREHMLIIYYFIYVYIIHNIHLYLCIYYIYILASQFKWDDWTSWQRVTATSNPWRCKDKRKCCISGPEIVMSKSNGQQLRVQNKVHIHPYSTT